MINKIQTLVHRLERYVDRWWYPPIVALLAFLDNFLIIVPTDGILISSIFISPKRWLLLSFAVGIGSSIGAILLGAFASDQGLHFIQDHFASVTESKTWEWTSHFFQKYGLFVLLLVGLSPLFQQPAVILAGLAGTPLYKLAIVILAGRLTKYLIFGYLASHTPTLIFKLWGVKRELRELDIHQEQPVKILQ